MDRKSTIYMYNVSSENSKQWTNFVVSIFAARIHKYFLFLFEYGRKASLSGLKNPEKLSLKDQQELVYNRFKHNCVKLQNWSIKNFEKEVQYYEEEIPNLTRVLALLFRLNFMALSMIRLNQNTRFKAPKVDKQKFIKDCYLCCASQVCYNNPHLFDDKLDIVKRSEYFQKASDEIRAVIREIIFKTVPIEQLTDKNKSSKPSKEDDSPIDPREAEIEARYKQEQLKTLGFALEDLQKKKKVSQGYKKKHPSSQFEETKKKTFADPVDVFASGSKVLVTSKSDRDYKKNVSEWVEQTESMLDGMNEQAKDEENNEESDNVPPENKPEQNAVLVGQTNGESIPILPPTKENLRMIDRLNEQELQQKSQETLEKENNKETFKIPLPVPIKKVPSKEKPSVCDQILEQVTPTKNKSNPSLTKISQPSPIANPTVPKKEPTIPPALFSKANTAPIKPKISKISEKPKPSIKKAAIPKDKPKQKEESEHEEESEQETGSTIVDSNTLSRKPSTNYGESEGTQETSQGEEENDDSQTSYSTNSKSEGDLGVDVDV